MSINQRDVIYEMCQVWKAIAFIVETLGEDHPDLYKIVIPSTSLVENTDDT